MKQNISDCLHRLGYHVEVMFDDNGPFVEVLYDDGTVVEAFRDLRVLVVWLVKVDSDDRVERIDEWLKRSGAEG